MNTRTYARTNTHTNAWTSAWICAALWAAGVATPAAAADDPALLNDLTAVIALLGLPCGQVVSATGQKDNDHIATCQNGNRYRVFINTEGRVVAERVKP